MPPRAQQQASCRTRPRARGQISDQLLLAAICPSPLFSGSLRVTSGYVRSHFSLSVGTLNMSFRHLVPNVTKNESTLAVPIIWYYTGTKSTISTWVLEYRKSGTQKNEKKNTVGVYPDSGGNQCTRRKANWEI